jgi:SAM-dependent methyltransferase
MVRTETDRSEFLSNVVRYYDDKLARYGETPHGVDWNGEASQTCRFAQLCKILHHDNCFCLNDLGCGYGALFDFLVFRHPTLSYLGIDISEEMIRAARQRHIGRKQARFLVAAEAPEAADYGIASGIFNVRLGRPDDEWYEYLKATLDSLNATSRRGFAFNCLTSYSDEDKKREYLFYADPCRLFDLCKRRYSRQVALLHDYGLYEFTILVRKAT